MNSLRLLQFASSSHASMRRMTLGRSQIVVHFLLSSIFPPSFRCHRSKTPESPANAALLLRTDIGSS
jgi:hypothetical protein